MSNSAGYPRDYISAELHATIAAKMLHQFVNGRVYAFIDAFRFAETEAGNCPIKNLELSRKILQSAITMYVAYLPKILCQDFGYIVCW
jgi:hypothetical protein